MSRRHLAYHVYPVRGRWQQGIDQLLRRADLFTGAKCIAVAVDESTDPWESVRDYAADLGADVFPVSNVPKLREVATWEPLWRRLLAVAKDDDFAFYAHGKGVTRPVGKWPHLQGWIDTLYAANMDHWPHVERLLADFPIVGAFLWPGEHWGAGHGVFCFRGTFFWMRVAGLRQRLTTAPLQAWWAIEAWPGMAYRLDEAGCVFDCPLTDLADGDQTPAWRAWVEERGGGMGIRVRSTLQVLTEPFSCVIIDGAFDPPKLFCPPTEWDGWEVVYRDDVQNGKRTTRNLHRLPADVSRVFADLMSDDFAGQVGLMLGISGLEPDHTLHGGGLHAMPLGSKLNGHLDYALHPKLAGKERRANAIAFLNPEWTEQLGGPLCLFDPKGEPVEWIYPRPGRLVIFETSDVSYHGVMSVGSRIERVTAAVYYLTDARPGVTRQRALFFPTRAE